jgi:hypothetical protein
VRVEWPAGAATKSRVTVYDLQGRLLHTYAVTGSSHTLDTSTWVNGTYFVQVTSGTAVSTQRLVVAH